MTVQSSAYVLILSDLELSIGNIARLGLLHPSTNGLSYLMEWEKLERAAGLFKEKYGWYQPNTWQWVMWHSRNIRVGCELWANSKPAGKGGVIDGRADGRTDKWTGGKHSICSSFNLGLWNTPPLRRQCQRDTVDNEPVHWFVGWLVQWINSWVYWKSNMLISQLGFVQNCGSPKLPLRTSRALSLPEYGQGWAIIFSGQCFVIEASWEREISWFTSSVQRQYVTILTLS